MKNITFILHYWFINLFHNCSIYWDICCHNFIEAYCLCPYILQSTCYNPLWLWASNIQVRSTSGPSSLKLVAFYLNSWVLPHFFQPNLHLVWSLRLPTAINFVQILTSIFTQLPFSFRAQHQQYQAASCKKNNNTDKLN